jgi:hypothetical protein
MKPPALEVRLILSAPGMNWEYIVRRCGEVIAASDGDACLESAGKAMVAGFAEAKANLAALRQDDAVPSPACEVIV